VEGISNHRLYKALKGLEYLLGPASVTDLIEGLNSMGILVLDTTERFYTLAQIRAALVKIFGEDATDILMDRIEKSLGA